MGLATEKKIKVTRKGKRYNNMHGLTLSVHIEISAKGIRVIDLSKAKPTNEGREYGESLFDETKVIIELQSYDTETISQAVQTYAKRNGYDRVNFSIASIIKGLHMEKVDYLH